MAQTDFIALYRGQTIAEARLVAVTAEPDIVTRFLGELTGETKNVEDLPRLTPTNSPRVVVNKDE